MPQRAAEPASRRVARIIRDQITTGQLAPGDQLPPILELARQYQVAPVTARKGLDILKAEGLIHSISGWGTFVSER